MLLFIFLKVCNLCFICRFQNISCYCLSKEAISNAAKNWIFQNISCYCLSFWRNACILYDFIFQNISCYCLSGWFAANIGLIGGFQNISCYCLSNLHKNMDIVYNYFKTSHVIVYLKRLVIFWGLMHISKHLMLLFIIGINLLCLLSSHFKTSHVIVYRVIRMLVNQLGVFQNISCYCLSVTSVPVIFTPLLFQNISCYCLSLAFPRF